MVATLMPAGPFGQCASACFLFVGLFGDVLLIRFFLTLAYIFLLVGAATGYPKWEGFQPGAISVDGLVWASVCLVLHSFALCRLLLDERPIHFKSQDEEELWRFFYRRSGMGRLEMKQVLKYGQWIRVPAGQPILSLQDSRLRVCVLVEGQAAMHTVYHGWEDVGQIMHSGSVFDFGLLNIFGIYIGFEKDAHKSFRAVAHMDCLLYTWDVRELNTMATQLSPAVAAFWRNFVLSQLGMEFDWRSHIGAVPVCATAEPERPSFLKGARSRDFTDPLRAYEIKRRSVKGFFSWLWRSLHPLLPAGIRHTALPVHGIMARNRVVTVKAAEALAALSREGSQHSAAARVGSSGGPESVPWVALEPAVDKQGGITVHRILRRLQSMGQLLGADMQQLARELEGPGGAEVLAAQILVGGAATQGGGPRCPVEGCQVQAGHAK